MVRARRAFETWFAIVSFLCALSSPSLCRAEEEGDGQGRVFLQVEGTCPEAARLEVELSRLLEQWTIVASEEEASEVARVSGVGETLSIEVVGDQKEILDAARDCAERARVAAVIIALRLEPAVGGETETGAPPGEQSEESSDEDRGKVVPRVRDLELGIGIAVDKSLDRSLGASLGPSLSLGFTSHRLLLYGSAAVQSASTIEASGVPLTFVRFPLDVGVGLSLVRGDWVFQPLALLALDNFWVSAEGLNDAEVSGRFELGPRLSLRVSRSKGRWRPFVFLRTAWFPREYVVEAEPHGELMTTPRFWMGAGAGFGLPLIPQ